MKQNEASEAREASLTELRHLSIVPFKAPVRWASLMSHGRMVAQPFFFGPLHIGTQLSHSSNPIRAPESPLQHPMLDEPFRHSH